MTTKTALLATLVLAAAACEKSGEPSNPPADGGNTETTPAADGGTEAADGGETATAPGAPDVKWADKSFQQRKEWMGIEVLPKMKGLFQEYDNAQFKGFGCDTCHGDDGKDKEYKMPSDAIYPLPKADPITAAMEYDEAVTKFMMERVVPETAALLDMEPYNPETGEGFGCFGCHPAE
ncbi:MAG: hypothetical protein K0V04_27490 [Deltaproteobacteria bacterium]|nr:hypothetical protein [Deltaproteobacteria bacterium]